MKNFTRRDFLRTASVAGGGLVLSSGMLKAAGASGKKLNVAMVGVGAEGRVLLQSLLKLPNLNFVAICDIWKSYAQRYAIAMVKKTLKQDAKGYEDYKLLIKNHAKDLDAVFIATPDCWHAPMTVDFLEAGVNVYCEKMMSDTLEGARKMVLAARKSGKLLQIGHQRKSNPRYIYAREKLLRGASICGNIMACNGQWNRAVSFDLQPPKNQKYTMSTEELNKYGYKNMHQFLNWRWYKGFGGGAISDLGAHQIDIFGWMLGARPSRVMASGSRDYYKKPDGSPAHDWDDNVMCIFEFDKTFQGKKAQVFYQVLTTTSAGGGYFESFMGDQGTLKMSENPALIKLFRENNAPKWDTLIEEGVIGGSDASGASVKIADSRESAALVSYNFPDKIPGVVVIGKDKDGNTVEKPIHMYHLENFLGAVRGENKLNCDAEHAYEAEAAVFKAREAIENGPLTFEESDFVVS